MTVQRFDIAQNLARLLELVGVQQAAAHQKTDCAPGVHHVAPDAPVQIFLLRDRVQRGCRILIGKILLQHAPADVFQIQVNPFQRIGTIFGVGGKQVEQHILEILDRTGTSAGAHAHQPEHRQILVVNGKQHALGQDEGYRDAARWALFLFYQEIGAQMQIAVFRIVITRRSLDVLDFVLARQDDLIDALDPVPLRIVGFSQIHPDRVDTIQIGARADIHLFEPAILQNESINH